MAVTVIYGWMGCQPYREDFDHEVDGTVSVYP